jgi:hypothetical protein
MSAVPATVAAQPMTRAQYGRLLNALLEAERADAKLLAAYGDELPTDSDTWAWLRVIQRDEGRNCSVLIHLLLEEGLEPGVTVGGSYRTGLEIRGWRERLRFLIRSQEWVAQRIAAALPNLSHFVGRRSLEAMYESHMVNIGICEKQLR